MKEVIRKLHQELDGKNRIKREQETRIKRQDQDFFGILSFD